MQFHRLATPLFLLGFAFPSAALTLGPLQGTAWIGKSFDVVVPVSLGEGEAGGGLCAEAELTQGTARVDEGRITVTVVPGAQAGSSRMRIRSSVVIDEPLVHLTVRAGCTMKSSREYVLLADVPTDIALPGVAALPSMSMAPVLPAVPESTTAAPDGGGRAATPAEASTGSAGTAAPFAFSAPSAASASPSAPMSPRSVDSSTPTAPPQQRRAAAPTAQARASAAESQRRRAAAAKPADASGSRATSTTSAATRAAAAKSAATAPATTAATAVAGKAPATASAVAAAPAAAVPSSAAASAARPRLQLDSFDPAAAANPALAASAASVAGAGVSASAAAAAALQTNPDGTPVAAAPVVSEEAERAAQRMQALEATLATLREKTAQHERALLDMRSEVADARDSRYSNPLVYVLVALLILALIALVLLWRLARGAAVAAWWNDSVLKDDGRSARKGGSGDLDDDSLQGPEGRRLGALPASASAATVAAAIEEEDEEDDSRYANLGVDPVLAPMDGDVPVRHVNTEELFDVQQQSDFFLSLGQHEQAIAVLSEHIAENPQTSALAYLDLLRIHHSLDRRDEYARVGREFERAFNAAVPSFDQFAEAGQGLEHYRGALSRIEAQWPAPETLSLIEELVFRKPGANGDEAFDLAAYQELLLLYAVAKEVIHPDSAPPAPVTPLSFLDTNLQGPLTAPGSIYAPIYPPAPVSPPAFPPTFPPLDKSFEVQTQPGALGPSTTLNTVTEAPEAHLRAASSEPSLYGELENRIKDDAATETKPGDLESPSFLEASPNRRPDAPWDSRLSDFELFDPTVEAEIAPKPTRR